MYLDFTGALAVLNGTNGMGMFTIMNEARPAADYVYAQLLPEMNKPTFQAKSGRMTVRATMAGVSGMDSAYAKVGAISVRSMQENTAKITSEVTLDEETQREILAILQATAASNGGMIDQSFMRDEALNFLNKLIIQAHLDMSEFLRGRAIANGALSFTYNGIPVSVSYGIPAANVLTQRTGTARYGSTASTFWADIRALQAALGYNVRAFIIGPQLLQEALANDVNRIQVTSQDGMTINMRRQLNDQGTLSSDSRDTVQLIVYNKEGEIYDLATPGLTTKIPFHPKTKLVAIGNGAMNGSYVVGQGSTPTPSGALGYHHLAPTIEGGGRMGRWARVYVPEGRPYQLTGQGVANEMPIIDMPEQIAIADSLTMV